MKQRAGPFPKGAIVDMAGWKFGRLTVLKQVGNASGGSPLWLCQCECGNQHEVRSGNLRNGGTRSCGCLHRETRGDTHRTHSMSGTPGHKTWMAMRGKCLDHNSVGYKSYGARGIGICDRWRDDAATFIEDISPIPKGKCFVLKDTDRDFEPGNVEWIDRIELAARRKNTRLVTWRGETHPLSAWPRHLEIDIAVNTLWNRIRVGWSIDRAFTIPVRGYENRRRKRLEAEGV